MQVITFNQFLDSRHTAGFLFGSGFGSIPISNEWWCVKKRCCTGNRCRSAMYVAHFTRLNCSRYIGL